MDELPAIRRLLVFLALISAFVTAYFARDLILPIILGFLLALTLSPVSRVLNRAGVPHAVSAFVLVTATAVVVLGIIGGSAGTVAVWSEEFPEMSVEIQQKLRFMSETLDDVREATAEVENMGGRDEGGTASAVQEVVVKQPTMIDTAFSTLSQFGATLAVTLILAMFLLSSGHMFYLKLVQAMPTMSEKKRALATVHDVERRVSRYLLTITLINIGLGICVWLYLTALGLPGAYVWGIVACLLNFLPYLGGFVGAFLVAAYSIVTFDSVGYALLAPFGYLVMTTLEGQFITPWIVGRRLALNTVAVFLTVVFWGWLWGIPGALVAVPFLVVFKVICENFEGLETLGSFLSADTERSVSVVAQEG